MSSDTNLTSDHFIDICDESGSGIWLINAFGSVPGIVEDPVLSYPVVGDSSFGGIQLLKTITKPVQIKKEQKDKLYFCTICGVSFSSSSNLKSHGMIHTGEKPYSCDICGIAFVQASNLKSHKRLHSGEKPYQCNQCGKYFTRSSHLKSHSGVHNGEHAFSCSTCSKRFRYSAQLKKHMAIHLGPDSYACHFCQKLFNTSSSLEIHVRLHVGERPYLCTECLAAFRSKEDLFTHKKLHSENVNYYSCSKCGKEFKIKLCCQKHTAKCTRDKTSRKWKRRRKSETEECEQKSKDFEEPENSFFIENDLEIRMLKNSIEDGMESEIHEHTLVLTIDG